MVTPIAGSGGTKLAHQGRHIPTVSRCEGQTAVNTGGSAKTGVIAASGASAVHPGGAAPGPRVIGLVGGPGPETTLAPIAAH